MAKSINPVWLRRIAIAAIVGAALVAATVYVVGNHVNNRTMGSGMSDATW